MQATVKMAEASGVVEFDDEEVLHFDERNKPTNTARSDLNI
jgi:hypothetical protein